MSKGAIFFDYDGTLHESNRIYAPAFRKAYEFLVKGGHAQERDWEDVEISKWLGFSAEDMWRSFMPDLDASIRSEASKMIGDEMNRLLEEGRALLYEGALEVLGELKGRGYTLVFISNCSNKYMNMARNLFDLDRYFDTMLCTQDFGGIPKYEIIKSVLNMYNGDNTIVGDRFQDIEAGKRNNMTTIGCTYGYGTYEELRESDYLISDIRELTSILK